MQATTATNIRSPKPVKNRATKVQTLRFYAQLGALALNVWIGVQFYLFVQYVRSGDAAQAISRPPGVEGWLPIGSLVSLRYWWESGILNEIHPSGAIILLVVLVSALLFRKAFCSWVCPVGFFSEILGDFADKTYRRRLRLPRWLDYPLRGIKYLLLAFFFWAILIQMTPESIKAFVYSDYNVVSDILMLRFFTDISTFSLAVIGGLFVLSLIIRGFWCRYLCPYGALVGLLGLLSPTRIKRNVKTCIDCTACAKVCPSFIKVDQIKSVNSDECTGCMACVDACPVDRTLEVKVGNLKSPVPVIRWAAVVLIFFWGTLAVAKFWGPWENSVSDQQYMERVHQADRGEYVHP
ncbi:MAG: 4Fe-4S binding protein [candidate division Zixibacteria bacterium]|nr:4Fe-4S binding protein [candidate division Zixibacteria bacterium]